MSDYLTITAKERKEMLSSIGVSRFEDLLVDIPESLRLKKLDLPSGKSQQECLDFMNSLADMNKVYPIIMRGAGSYNHYIPSVVKDLATRSEFTTAYTPYQPEMSQGILQAIFEYQTHICNLTGMDVSNASVYNGSTAAADAMLMCRDAKRKVALVADNIRPDTMSCMETYAKNSGTKLVKLPAKEGVIDLATLSGLLSDQVACVYIEQPNFFGLLEEAAQIGSLIKRSGSKFIMGCNPISLALLKTPRECGADIAVGDGQPLGMPLGFGGPYLGFIAATASETRKMSGRIVGETTDHDGNRAYVLTLQAREQHIRREKALSNICSNQAHCALTASIYLSAMGAIGLREVASTCVSLAHMAADMFKKSGLTLKYSGEFFHEFVTTSKVPADTILAKLEKKGILGGYKLSEYDILWCMTEALKKKDIQKAASLIKGACL